MVNFARTSFGVSVRRACRAVPANRSSYHYQSIRPSQEPLRKRIREIAETRVRYGYRRIHIILRREGWSINVKRVRRLYRPEGLQMRLKPPRRRVMAKLRSDRSNATGPNQRWSLDFVSDALAEGRRFRTRVALAAWRDDYNTVRPHSATGNQPPAIYAKLSVPTMQRDGTLEHSGGSAPHLVAPPSQMGSNAKRTLLMPG